MDQSSALTPMPAPTLTEDEHHARAMLMGMSYHHGNGFGFYYTDTDGVIDPTSFLDADTMEPFLKDLNRVDRDGYGTVYKKEIYQKMYSGKGMK